MIFSEIWKKVEILHNKAFDSLKIRVNENEGSSLSGNVI